MLSTSLRLGALVRYLAIVDRMNLISSSSATGSRLGEFMGVSVVPTTILSCHGTAHSTLPSSVLGIIRA